MPEYRNRIVGYGRERPTQLLASPRNWRIHPFEQEQALAGVLNDVGWVQNIIVNRRTGCVVDGHLRVAHAISKRESEVPVAYVDLSEEEEALILATIDPISAMAAADQRQFQDLLREIHTGDDTVNRLLQTVATDTAWRPLIPQQARPSNWRAEDVELAEADIQTHFATGGQVATEAVTCPHCGGEFLIDRG